MSATMVSHIRILDENREYVPERYDPTTLEPLDAAKVVLEQAIYLRYLIMTSGYAEVGLLDDFRKKITTDISTLPLQVSLPNSDLETLYQMAIITARSLVSDDYAHQKPQHMNLKPVDYFTLFNTPPQRDYIHREYLPTLSEDFLVMLLALDYGWFDRDTYKNGKLNPAAIYLPSVETSQIYHPEMRSSENTDYRIVISLKPKAIDHIDLDIAEVGSMATELGWLRHFDMKDLSLDDLIGVLACFSIDRSKYHMTNNSCTTTVSVPDVCYDLVTGSHYSTPSAAGTDGCERNCESTFEVFKYLLTKGYIQPLKEWGLFGELLTRLGASQDLVNYFIKPVEKISASEALAFRTSSLAAFIPDRFIVGMEAVDEDNQDEAEPSMEFEQDAGSAEEGEEGNSELPDASSGDDLGDTGDTPEEDTTPKEKPHIDPDRMLLELANPNETMSDYIYREMVARRINTILNNPPANARPNDLLMLKRWRSRWLYLVNIPCLRDFLTRISLRLSDV